MELRAQIAALVDGWAREEHRATYLTEPMHERCKRNLVDRLEAFILDVSADAGDTTPTMDDLKARVKGKPRKKGAAV